MSSPALSFEVEGSPDTCVTFRLSGKYELLSGTDFRYGTTQLPNGKAVNNVQLATDAQEVVFDLTSLALIDSSGLGTLVAIRRGRQQQGRSEVKIKASPAVYQSLKITGLLKIFDVERVDTATPRRTAP